MNSRPRTNKISKNGWKWVYGLKNGISVSPALVELLGASDKIDQTHIEKCNCSVHVNYTLQFGLSLIKKINTKCKLSTFLVERVLIYSCGFSTDLDGLYNNQIFYLIGNRVCFLNRERI